MDDAAREESSSTPKLVISEAPEVIITDPEIRPVSTPSTDPPKTLRRSPLTESVFVDPNIPTPPVLPVVKETKLKVIRIPSGGRLNVENEVKSPRRVMLKMSTSMGMLREHHPAEDPMPNTPTLSSRIWINIFALLNSRTIVRCRRTCQQWNRIINNNPTIEWKAYKRWRDTAIKISFAGKLMEKIYKQRYLQYKKHMNESEIQAGLLRKAELPKELKRFEAKYGLCLKVLESHSNPVHFLKYHFGFIYSASNEENDITCWKASGSYARPSLRFIGHIAGITVLKIKNGNLYSGSLDGTAKIWDVQTGRLQQTLQPHTKGVSCIKIMHDGSLITGANDGKIAKWNIKTGMILTKYYLHQDPVSSVQLSSTEEYLFSLSEDETLRRWNMEIPEDTKEIKSGIMSDKESLLQNSISTFRLNKGKVIYGTLSGMLCVLDMETLNMISYVRAHRSPIVSLKVKRGNIYVACEDGTYSIWNLLNLAELHRIDLGKEEGEGDIATIHLMQVVGQDALYMSVGYTIHKFNIKTGRLQQNFVGHTAHITSIKADKSGRTLISGGASGMVRIWCENAEKANALQDVILKGHSGFVTDITVIGDTLISISNDGTARSWSIKNGTCLQVFKSNTGDITCMATQEGQFLWTGSDRFISKWNIKEGTCMLFLKGHTKTITNMLLFQDQFLFSGSADHTIRKWNLQSGKMIQVMSGHKDRISCLAAFSSARLISGSADKTLTVWGAARGDLIHKLTGHTAKINDIKVEEDNKIIFSCSDDKTIRAWSMETGSCLHIFRSHNKIVHNLRYYRSKLYAGSYDSSISLNQLELKALKDASREPSPNKPRPGLTRRSAAPEIGKRSRDVDTDTCKHFRGHKAGVLCLAFDPLDKENRIYSGSEDGTIKGWDVKNQSCVLTFTGHSKRVNTVVVTNETVISASNDKTIRLWAIEDSSAIFLAARYGQLLALKHLVEQNDRRLFERGYLDRTPLMVATNHGQTPVVLFYMEHSDESRQLWHTANAFGETCLYFIFIESRWNLLARVSKILPDCAVQHPKEKQFLTEKVAQNNFTFLNEFLTAKISYTSISAELIGLASANDALESVQAFVRHDPSCINHRDSKGRTPLHHAAEKSRHRIILFLLKHNANLNVLDQDGQSPLHLSVNRGHMEGVKTLIERGCVVNCFDKKGLTPLHIAIRNNNVDIVEFLTQQVDLNTNVQDAQGKTPMHYALNDRGGVKSGLVVLEGIRKPDMLIKDNNDSSAYIMLVDRIAKCRAELLKPKTKHEKKTDREDFLEVSELLHQANGLPSVKAYRQRFMILKFLKSFGVFMLFLLLLTTHVFLNTTLGDSNSFFYNRSLYESFIGDSGYTDIKSDEHFYNWMKSSFVDKYYSHGNMNHTYAVGTPRLTQFRVSTNSCVTDAAFSVDNCHHKNFMKHESVDTYGLEQSFVWRTSDQMYLAHSQTTGWILTTGGFIVDLPESKEEAVNIIEKLEAGKWIDGNTRVIFLDFTIYSPSLDLFSVVRLDVEFAGSGATIVDYDLVILNLYQFFRVDIYLLLDIIVYIMIVTQTTTYVRGMLGKKGTISAYPLTLVMLFSAMIILRFISVFSAYYTLTQVNTNVDGYINFHFLGVMNNFYKDISALVLTLAWLQLLNALQTFPIFGEKVHAILTTLVSPAVRMLVFLFVVVILSFSFAFHAAFGSRVETFKAPIESFLTLIGFVFGGFETEEIFHISPVIGPVLFILFMSFAALVLLNIFIAVISEYYSETQEDTKSWEIFVDTIIMEERTSTPSWLSSRFAQNRFSKRIVGFIMYIIDDTPSHLQAPTSESEMTKNILLKNRAAHSQQTVAYTAKEIEELSFTPFEKEKKGLEDLIEMEQVSNQHTHDSLLALSKELSTLLDKINKSNDTTGSYRSILDERVLRLQRHVDRVEQKLEASSRKNNFDSISIRPVPLKQKSSDQHPFFKRR